MDRWKVVPSQIMTRYQGGYAVRPVLSVVAHAPRHHPEASPCRPDWTAVEVKTDGGTRWFGTTAARINSRLQMTMIVNMRDEVLAKWDDADPEA